MCLCFPSNPEIMRGFLAMTLLICVYVRLRPNEQDRGQRGEVRKKRGGFASRWKSGRPRGDLMLLKNPVTENTMPLQKAFGRL